MKVIMLILVVFFSLANLGLVVIADDKRVYNSLTKKELYKLSIIKDILSGIIILLLVILAFI